MGELAGELMALFADGFRRTLQVARARRRLAAGRPARIPCSARADGPGPRGAYVAGRLRLAPGAPSAAFTARGRARVELAAGGTFHAPEPDTWYDQDWAATAYRAPGAAHAVHLQVDSRLLPLLHAVLGAPGTPQNV
ncbi:hypothetical protein ACFXAF_28700 [Kitasatospora sp. NPDC059463]|uniref:hypothetical protein n=1 Tax=unclassified Kitasatospora TaxID=2633591 RepID=UPI0036A2AFA2